MNLKAIIEYTSDRRDKKYSPKYIVFPTIRDIMNVAYQYVVTGDYRYLLNIDIDKSPLPLRKGNFNAEILDICVQMYCMSASNNIEFSNMHSIVDPILYEMCVQKIHMLKNH